MSSPSIASKTFALIDVPEPENYSVTFQYFGYDLAAAIAAKGDAMQVVIQFTMVTDTTEFVGAVAELNVADETVVVDALMEGAVLDESVSVANFTNIILQDHFVAEKAGELLAAAIAGTNVDIEELSSMDGAGAIVSAFVDNGTTGASTVDETISDEIVAAILRQDALNDSLDLVGEIEIAEEIFGSIAGIQHMNVIDSRVVMDVARISAKNPFGAFAGNVSYMVTDLEDIQATAIADAEAEGDIISTAFYEAAVTPIKTSLPGAPEVYKLGNAIVVGYLVEKTEITDDGEAGETSAFFIPQGDEALPGEMISYVDEDIEIATSYSYSTSTIAVARIPSVQYGAGDIADVDIVLKSRLKTAVITTGVGFPPPPSDISFVYDSSSKKLLMQWDFGENDINTVRFQILRRDTIKQPFSLIRQYSFDSSVAIEGEEAFPELEDVDFGLDVILDKALLYYIDEEFAENREYIYALCSIGSDGGSSPYSEQYSVRYDSTLGELVVRQISVAYAPKPYPNMYLEVDLTKPAGQVSNVSSLDFYFTPEVLNVTRNTYDAIETDAVIDTLYMEFLKENGPLTNTGQYSLELTELGTFQQASAKITLVSDDDPVTGDPGLILDPSSV